MASVIWLRRDAPLKPALGDTCNGCGVCCASEPCPVARAYLWQFRGSCKALEWDDHGKRYRCGLLLHPRLFLLWLPARFENWFLQRVSRKIAAGIGCDSSFEAESVDTSA
ncbi:MAG: hypothetical protein KGM99_13240 [Burkholderiales bacterium]|nr:hypothetical protein [Burkholderiales bacterium]